MAALILGALILLAVGFYIFYDIGQFVLNQPRKTTSAVLIGAVINAVLLVFIIVELVETAYEQVEIALKERGRLRAAGTRGAGIGKALGKPLAKKLLIIGLLASIRHLLAIGVELSGRTYPSGTHLQEVLEGLGVATGMVIGLALVLVAVVKWYDPKDDLTEEELQGRQATS